MSVEVLFSSTATFVLMFVIEDRYWTTRAAGEPPWKGVNVMRVARDGNGDPSSELDDFCTLVRSSISAALDGRRTRHWPTEWKVPSASISRIKRLKNQFADEDVPLVLSPAQFDPPTSHAAEVLADRRTRELLIEIAQARFARETDVLSKRGKAREEVVASLDAMKDHGLIVTEHILQCEKTSSPLIRLSDPSQLTTESTGDLKCAHCGRKFSEESLSEGYSLSEVGRQLSRGSHWMTVWVTDRLTDLGVPIESIVWNLEESSEEVDLLFEHLGRLWIVELKDRDFGAGDAHPFNYRRVRYSANEAIVISAGKISTDAKRVFTELEKGAGRPRRAPTAMILIEGLDQVSPTLAGVFERAALDRVQARLGGPSSVTGFDLAQVAAQRS
ncbi:hypothetical protein [Phycicoccus sp.]|uniref:hypothetical protein n=1 Tax=Phycicoccus sp. TaxID=1902410 RepID=UPI002C0A2721|nr:hypothetical protein [Phycicoccus sp.]HMM96126.1 hypothetical protein [Phycicoccus sp.]